MANDPQATPAPIQWTEHDAVLLRDFLHRCPRFLAVLDGKRPKPTKTETMEARAISGIEQTASEHMLTAIKELAKGSATVTERSPFIGAGES